MDVDFNKIISDAVLAPSGENCQPWRFRRKGTALIVRNDPSADTSIYNTKQKGSLAAIGAAIENAVISASHQGFAANVTMFPNADDPELVGALEFTPGTYDDPLYSVIANRCTNRKIFTGETMTAKEKESLHEAARARGAQCVIVDSPDTLAALGDALAVNERLLFENRALHDFFYGHILWNAEEQTIRSGFYYETLEFLPHQLKAVRLLKHWPLLRALNATIGMGKMIAKENAQKYAGSGSLAALLIEGRDARAYAKAGRAIERVWLAATAHGLSVHPCTGVLYFMEQIRDGGADRFSAAHRALIEDAYQTIARLINAGSKTIPMLMRIGRADEPTARSLRFPIESVILTI